MTIIKENVEGAIQMAVCLLIYKIHAAERPIGIINMSISLAIVHSYSTLKSDVQGS